MHFYPRIAPEEHGSNTYKDTLLGMVSAEAGSGTANTCALRTMPVWQHWLLTSARWWPGAGNVSGGEDVATPPAVSPNLVQALSQEGRGTAKDVLVRPGRHGEGTLTLSSQHAAHVPQSSAGRVYNKHLL